MVSKQILRMGTQKTPIQKTYEIQKGSDSLNIEFLGANRQIDGIEISIVPDKSDKHKTSYDSYNREIAAQLIKTLKQFYRTLQFDKRKKIRHGQFNSTTFAL